MGRALVLLLGLSLALPVAGRAQEAPSADEQAQRMVDAAVEAYRSRRYAVAVDLFKQAHALRADPAILYNLAKCYEKMGQPQEALEYYRRYLVAEDTDPRLREKAERSVAALRRAIAPPPQAAPPRPAPRPGRLFFYSGLGLASAGVASLGVGVGLYGAAAAQYATYTASSDELDKRAARQQAQDLGRGSIIGYAVGAGLLAGGAVLIGLAAWKGFFHKETRVSLLPFPEGGGLLCSGAF
ncbi:MAG: tetratricopeptide repeat protein [Myxococcales bacterium]|nr:tetratricopeptide repeat protein [Myxococcota bacterium]MDW8280899.1 tetratricopeptide repeat protein [Myxococcales bacterium]